MMELTVLVEVHDHILFRPDLAIKLMGIKVLNVTLLGITLSVVDNILRNL